MDSFHVVYGVRGDFGFLFLRVPKRNLLRGGAGAGPFSSSRGFVVFVGGRDARGRGMA